MTPVPRIRPDRPPRIASGFSEVPHSSGSDARDAQEQPVDAGYPTKSLPVMGQYVLRAGQIAAQADADWLLFQQHWGPVHRGLTGFNLLHYSARARR